MKKPVWLLSRHKANSKYSIPETIWSNRFTSHCQLNLWLSWLQIDRTHLLHLNSPYPMIFWWMITKLRLTRRQTFSLEGMKIHIKWTTWGDTALRKLVKAPSPTLVTVQSRSRLILWRITMKSVWTHLSIRISREVSMKQAVFMTHLYQILTSQNNFRTSMLKVWEHQKSHLLKTLKSKN
jgi:hypothetical protein